MVISLNVSRLNLPESESKAIVECYEQILAERFSSKKEITFDSMLKWLSLYPRIREGGLPPGFAKILFNLMLAQPKLKMGGLANSIVSIQVLGICPRR